MLVDVEEVGRAEVRVAVGVAGVDRREVDGGLDARVERVVGGDELGVEARRSGRGPCSP